MAVMIWTPGSHAENICHLTGKDRDREAWSIHRRATREKIEEDIARAEALLAAPEMDPGYAQFYSRAEFDARMRDVIAILRTSLEHKAREEADPRFAQLYAALESLRDEAEAALAAVYDEGLKVRLAKVERALTQARRAQEALPDPQFSSKLSFCRFAKMSFGTQYEDADPRRVHGLARMGRVTGFTAAQLRLVLLEAGAPETETRVAIDDAFRLPEDALRARVAAAIEETFTRDLGNGKNADANGVDAEDRAVFALIRYIGSDD